MDGATDVQSGRISAGPKGGDGGWDEHAGSSPDVWPAPGHRAQDAGLLRAARVTAETDLRPESPKLEPYTGVIDRILEDDLSRPRKQRHTAKRIFERLRDEYGFDGGYTTVKDYVRENRRQTREMFVPSVPSAGTRPVRLRGGPGGHRRRGAQGPLLHPGPAPQRRLLREGIPRRRPPRPSWTGTFPPSPTWAECPRASSTTIPGWP